MTPTIIGIRADDRFFHIPCANRVYGDDTVYLTMYPEVYEGEDFVRDSGGIPVNTVPTFRVSPEQRDFSGKTIMVVTDDDSGYTPQICSYPLCWQLVDGTDVVPEDFWRERRDKAMRRYSLQYAFHTRDLAFEDGMVVEDCMVEELDYFIWRFRETFQCAPVMYIGGNNLLPLAHYDSLISVRPLKAVARGDDIEEVSLAFSETFSLPVRTVTGVWETVVLLRMPLLAEAARHFIIPADLHKRSYEALCEATQRRKGEG